MYIYIYSIKNINQKTQKQQQHKNNWASFTDPSSLYQGTGGRGLGVGFLGWDMGEGEVGKEYVYMYPVLLTSKGKSEGN